MFYSFSSSCRPGGTSGMKTTTTGVQNLVSLHSRWSSDATRVANLQHLQWRSTAASWLVSRHLCLHMCCLWFHLIVSFSCAVQSRSSCTCCVVLSALSASGADCSLCYTGTHMAARRFFSFLLITLLFMLANYSFLPPFSPSWLLSWQKVTFCSQAIRFLCLRKLLQDSLVHLPASSYPAVHQPALCCSKNHHHVFHRRNLQSAEFSALISDGFGRLILDSIPDVFGWRRVSTLSKSEQWLGIDPQYGWYRSEVVWIRMGSLLVCWDQYFSHSFVLQCCRSHDQAAGLATFTFLYLELLELLQSLFYLLWFVFNLLSNYFFALQKRIHSHLLFQLITPIRSEQKTWYQIRLLEETLWQWVKGHSEGRCRSFLFAPPSDVCSPEVQK